MTSIRDTTPLVTDMLSPPMGNLHAVLHVECMQEDTMPVLLLLIYNEGYQSEVPPSAMQNTEDLCSVLWHMQTIA